MQALVVSCNTCFYDVGYNLDGQDNTLLPNTAKSFGLGQSTGIQGVAESPGLIPDPEWKMNNRGEGWATGDAVNMAIGQGYVQVTPLQFVNLVAAIANGGTLHTPSVVDRIGAGAGRLFIQWRIFSTDASSHTHTPTHRGAAISRRGVRKRVIRSRIRPGDRAGGGRDEPRRRVVDRGLRRVFNRGRKLHQRGTR